MDMLATHLDLPDHDLLLVGDGSGTSYEKPVGWTCIAHDRRRPRVTVHVGTLSCGTNNVAELLPYVQALWHHSQDHAKAPATPVPVVIVSDSEVTVRCGNRQYARRANACIWAEIDAFEKLGYCLHWHHVARNSNPWHALADTIAGQARLLMEAWLANLGPVITDRAVALARTPNPFDPAAHIPKDPFAHTCLLVANIKRRKTMKRHRGSERNNGSRRPTADDTNRRKATFDEEHLDDDQDDLDEADPDDDEERDDEDEDEEDEDDLDDEQEEADEEDEDSDLEDGDEEEDEEEEDDDDLDDDEFDDDDEHEEEDVQPRPRFRRRGRRSPPEDEEDDGDE
jgi:ribonuclease HI